nr:hypothetical protein [Tanacetum cinerariifolium]
MNKTNEPVIPSTRLKGATTTSGSKPRSKTKKDRTLPAKSDMKKVEDEEKRDEKMILDHLKQRSNNVDDVSLVDGVFDGAFGEDEEEDVVMGEGVVVTSSSLEMLTKSFLGRIMVSLNFLEGLEEEA